MDKFIKKCVKQSPSYYNRWILVWVDLLFNGFDQAFRCLIGLIFLADLLDSMDDRRVITSSKQRTNGI